ncbi:unnamed protein product, partial [Pleuronectes platessa]
EELQVPKLQHGTAGASLRRPANFRLLRRVGPSYAISMVQPARLEPPDPHLILIHDVLRGQCP